ncbi:MAG: succinate dehydrogenase/fumarate reductase iron-sulfur subunit [Burkholderiales bacterium]
MDARRLGQVENLDTLRAKLDNVRVGDTLTAHVRRSTPGDPNDQPRYETFKVPYQKWMRVLDVLIYISEELESDLSYRWYCGSKMCGTCAMRVNGREILACWAAAEPEMTIEPLRNLPVIRDLTVDRSPYEKRVLGLKPWIEREAAYPGFPEPLSHREMRLSSKALDCISCAACYSACPVVGLGDVTNFAGPAPLVQIAQAALDPRDARDRSRELIEQAAIFSCVSCYRCEEVCPASIPIVSRVIEPLKAMVYRKSRTKPRHQHVFLGIVRRRGRIDPSELILRVQGLRAAARLRRVLSLLATRKINPLRTFFGRPISGIRNVRRLFRAFLRSS